MPYLPISCLASFFTNFLPAHGFSYLLAGRPRCVGIQGGEQCGIVQSHPSPGIEHATMSDETRDCNYVFCAKVPCVSDFAKEVAVFT